MKALTIFQVEDDEDFSYLMEHAIREINQEIILINATNGVQGLGLLNLYHENQDLPGMMLLDVNLPGMSGLNLLKIIRDIPLFRTIPIVVFSTSDNLKDKNTALEFGANEFMTKPMGYTELVKGLVILINKYLIKQPE